MAVLNQPLPENEIKLRVLAALVEFEAELRSADTLKNLERFMVDEGRRLLPYHQAVIFRSDVKGNLTLVALTDVITIYEHAPFVVWLSDFLTKQTKERGFQTSLRFVSKELKQSDQEKWQQWLPTFGFWSPMVDDNGGLLGGLFLARDVAWQEHELWLLQHVTLTVAHSWERRYWLENKPTFSLTRIFLADWRRTLAFPVGLLILAFLPTRLTVMAPAVVTPIAPVVVSSPLDGVIFQFHVAPNQKVTAGQLLFSLDNTVLKSQYEVAQKALAVEEANLAKATRKGFYDDRSKAEVDLLKATVTMKQTEVAFTANQLARVSVHAAQNGMAIFADAQDWLGKPVQVGEMILQLANPDQTEIEAWVPISDAINLAEKSPLTLFLNIHPSQPLPAQLIRADYEARFSPEGTLAFRVKASFSVGVRHPRIGLRGTAKIQGERVFLWYYLLRRPLAALRQSIGW